MTQQTEFTSFSGRSAFTTPDRDGYEEVVFNVDILLQFHADGRVFAREEDDVRFSEDADIAGDHDLAGDWRVGVNDIVHFDLKRVRSARERENEIPGDGSNYYWYPTVSTVACLADGSYSGLHANDRFVLTDQPSHVDGNIGFERLGDAAEGFPENRHLRKLDNPRQWATFQYGPFTETHQWTPDDEPHEHTEGFCLRMHADDNRVEVVLTDERQTLDILPYTMTVMEGTWSRDPTNGYLIELEKSRKDESDYQWPIKASRYWANFYAGKLCLHPIREGLAAGDRGPEERFYDLPPIDYESVWLPSVNEDPLADLRAQFEKDKQEAHDAWRRSMERLEAEAANPQPPQDQVKIAPPDRKIWDSPAFQMIFGAVFWIALIWLALTYFG